ncbi:MAG TPA: hypothetical protein VI915_05355 [Thermoplasmata archaeon]|nr:hypothetical protein [Thermoplasmata archaeon]
MRMVPAVVLVCVMVLSAGVFVSWDPGPRTTSTGIEPPGLPGGGDPGVTSGFGSPSGGPVATGVCGVSPDPYLNAPRHASTAKVGSVTHMVWEQVLARGGLPEICYANDAGGGNLGVGNGRNPARRVTDTPFASVWPTIAWDSASGILYVSWVEIVLDRGPSNHADYSVNARRLAASDDSFFTEMVYPHDLAYLGVWNRDVSALEDPDLVERALGPAVHFRLNVQAGELRIGNASHRHGNPYGHVNFIVDMDGDGIADFSETSGLTGYKTDWKRVDTDGDGIWDLWEIQHGLDPIFDQQKDCVRLKICDLLREGILFFLDLDGDGLSAAAEGLDYPVTTEVAAFPHGAYAEYRFWPKVSGNYSLVLRTQQRTFSAIGPCDTVAINVTVGGFAAGTLTQPWVDSSTWTWTTSSVPPFYLAADTAADVRLTVAFDPPACGQAILAVIRALAVDWLKLELSTNRAELDYKDADDFTTEALVMVSTEEMTIHLDPGQKDVLFELDSMAGHDFVPRVLNEVIDAYSDYNIIANFKIDETGLSATGTVSSLSFDWPPTSTDESSVYLSAHRNPALSAYVHVMNVHYIAGAGGIAEQSAPGDPASLGGVLLADQNVIDGTSAGSTLRFERRLALFLHETGHALGSHHETAGAALIDPVVDTGGVDICNQYNVMGWSYCSAEDKVLHGTGNTNRRFGSTTLIGRPRWSIESANLFNFGALLSVQVGNNMAGMLFV